MARQVGLDLGTIYTRIWTREKGIILRCPSAAAIDSQSHEVVALGVEAKKMMGKTPEDILAYRPVKDGVIADYEVAARMLNEFSASFVSILVTSISSVFFSSSFILQFKLLQVAHKPNTKTIKLTSVQGSVM